MPVTESHYTRNKNPGRRYCDPGSTTKKLFFVYVEFMNANFPAEKKVSLSKFTQIFTTDYNITPRYVKILNNF